MPWEILGQYELIERVGRGGAATVWRGRHVLLNSTHAVKVLTADSEELAQRMLREGRLQARLRHPAIVPVTDLIHSGERIALVMPFIEGGTLEDRLQRDGPLPVDEAITLFRHLLDGVHHAHRSGVLHRDIKPANVMLDGALARLTDFGLAGMLDAPKDGERLTRVGISLGTPGYMSPELWLTPADADARADVFSLAALLYDAMTGRAPFHGDSSRKIFDATMLGQFEPLHERVPSCPRELSDLVTRCLAPEPDVRPASCGALARRLGWDLDERSLPPMDDAPPREPAGLQPAPAGSSLGGLSIVANFAELIDQEDPSGVVSRPSPPSETLEPLPSNQGVEEDGDDGPFDEPFDEPPTGPMRRVAHSPRGVDRPEAHSPAFPNSDDVWPRAPSMPTWPPGEAPPAPAPPAPAPPTFAPPTFARPAPAPLAAEEAPPRPAALTPAPAPAPPPGGLTRPWLYAGAIGFLLALALLTVGLRTRADKVRAYRAEQAELAAERAAEANKKPEVLPCAGEPRDRLGWLYVESADPPVVGAVIELGGAAELRVTPPIEGIRAAVACSLEGGQRVTLGEGFVEEDAGRYWVPVDGEDLVAPVAGPVEGG